MSLKDLFKESYQQQTIIHMIINNYLINDKNYSSFIDNLRGDNLCLEINFKSISNDILVKFDKILEIYNENHENIDLEFSFVGTGIAKIRRLNDNGLKNSKKTNF